MGLYATAPKKAPVYHRIIKGGIRLRQNAVWTAFAQMKTERAIVAKSYAYLDGVGLKEPRINR